MSNHNLAMDDGIPDDPSSHPVTFAAESTASGKNFPLKPLLGSKSLSV
ncbi:MAG: hypothetical protein HQL07_05380 [Nitrospirae bacterium]|nr:hypothetical protein [Magnetococcales bacterium]